MEYFKQRGRTLKEALSKARLKYGESAKILSHKEVRHKGFLGLFAKACVEIEGFIGDL